MEGKNRMEQGNVLDGLHEECGVFGIYDFDGGNVASSVYYGLLALQHRGQESCGIAVGDTDGPRKVTTHKGMGLVNEVFTPEILENMHGDTEWVIPVILPQAAVPVKMHSRWF